MPDKNQGKMEEGPDRGIYEQVKRLDGQVVTGGGSPRQFGQKKKPTVFSSPTARITAGDVLELRCSTTTALCSKKCLMYFLSGRADVYQIGVYTALHQKIKDSTAHCVLFKLGVHCAVLECVGL